MILLDTNVISQAMTREADSRVRAWLDAQASETLFLSSVTVADVLFGIGVLPDGRRKAALAAALDDVLDLFAGRILPFDTSAARRYADLAVKARLAGRLPHTRWVYCCDRRGAPVHGRVARRERVQRSRADRDRPLDGGALKGSTQ